MMDPAPFEARTWIVRGRSANTLQSSAPTTPEENVVTDLLAHDMQDFFTMETCLDLLGKSSSQANMPFERVG